MKKDRHQVVEACVRYAEKAKQGEFDIKDIHIGIALFHDYHDHQG
jgi:hypothetical protein